VTRVTALRPLHQEVCRSEDALRSSERRLRHAQRDLEDTPRLIRHKSRANTRTSLERAKAHVASDAKQLAAAQVALRSGELASRTTPWTEAHRRQLDRLGSLDAQIRHLSVARGRELAGSPPPYLVSELGEPTGGNDRSWEHAVGEIESYRARWGIEDREDALPILSEVAEPHRQAVHDHLFELGYSVGLDGVARS
jgi:hypothetical protein